MAPVSYTHLDVYKRQGTTTLPVKIYSSVRMGVSLQVNALSTLMLATVFLLMAAFRLSRRARAAQSV